MVQVQNQLVALISNITNYLALDWTDERSTDTIMPQIRAIFNPVFVDA